PGQGGALVTYTGFHDKWPASLLFDGDPATSWVSYDTYFPQDFTIAFKDDRLAEIERVQLRLDDGPGSISWPSEIAIAVSETSPLDGFIETGRHTVEKRAGLQTFPVNRKARFIKVRVLDNYGAEKTTVSEINVIEAKQPGQRSILLSSAVSEETISKGLDTDNARPTAVTENEPNDDLAMANALEPGEVVEGTIDPFGELDYFALPEFGDDASALTLGYDGYPNIRHGLELLDAQGNVLSAFDPGDLPARNASLTFELLGQERFLRLSEPPSSVVVIWDTSGSMQGSEKDLERAVREYIRLAPENQSIQLIRFSDNVETVTSGFLTNKSELLSSLRGKFPSQGGTSLYDAIARGLSNLDSRDGNRAIVVMTDGEDNGLLWHNELWQKIASNRIRLYTIGLGSGLERYSRKYASTGERILGHLALGTNGESFFASESSALREFYARIANELASPAIYNLTPTIEKGQGSIRLIAVGEQVPAAAMPPVHVILDVSGSMSSKLGGGRSRMAAAKAAMLGLVNSLPEGMPFGLTVYGARIPESRGKALACTDIVTVQETAPLRHQPVNAFVNDVNPRGGTTPLWATIEHVLEKMKGEPDGIVVVITDGIEECNVDMIDKLLTLGIEESKLNTLGLELSGPAALEIEDKIRTLGLQKTELNVLGYDLRDQTAKGMMIKLAGIGGGEFYDVANGAALEEALKDAVAAPYKVLDATGRVVATGKIDGPSQPVPTGNYTVEIASSTGPSRTLDVRIDKNLTTTLTVNKVGNEMDVAAGSPTEIDPQYECGLPATKRSDGEERVRRVQQKLTNLKFDPNGVDGQVGKGTRAAISSFIDAHKIALPIEVSLVFEQHLDCLIAEGHLFAGAQ
ncbi:MAG: VWA domain-containing protein, partial [Paracoccaceae bacterium]